MTDNHTATTSSTFSASSSTAAGTAGAVADAPLHGVRVVEFAGIGPAPTGSMLLADMGADVIVIDRKDDAEGVPRGIKNERNPIHRGKRSIALNLKSDADKAVAWQLVERADVLIEGFRPGVMERLGFAPEEALRRNPKLIFARMTGWGQSGPLAHKAGHDINYVAITGGLAVSRRDGLAPVIPATLVGDTGGGAMYLAFGVVAALFQAQRTGRGQVVDAAIVDGVCHMLGLIHAFRAQGIWHDRPEYNLFANTSYFYEVFECADGRYLSVGAIEPQFNRQLLQGLGLEGEVPDYARMNPMTWPELKERVAEVIKTRTQQEWCDVFADLDACVAPVLSLQEAAEHPHIKARGSLVKVRGNIHPAPAPRFSQASVRQPGAGCYVNEHEAEIRAELAADSA